MKRRSQSVFLKLGSALTIIFICFLFRNAFASMIAAPAVVAEQGVRITGIESSVGAIKELFEKTTDQIYKRFDRVDSNQKELAMRVDKIYELMNQQRSFNDRR